MAPLWVNGLSDELGDLLDVEAIMRVGEEAMHFLLGTHVHRGTTLPVFYPATDQFHCSDNTAGSPPTHQ